MYAVSQTHDNFACFLFRTAIQQHMQQQGRLVQHGSSMPPGLACVLGAHPCTMPSSWMCSMPAAMSWRQSSTQRCTPAQELAGPSQLQCAQMIVGCCVWPAVFETVYAATARMLSDIH